MKILELIILLSFIGSVGIILYLWAKNFIRLWKETKDDSFEYSSNDEQE